MSPRCTVLVIEDDDDIRDAVRMLLELENYPVLDAPDGRAGLGLIATSATPLVVLVDYLMPRMNGLQLLREVANDGHLARRHVYVLVTANYDRLPPDESDLVFSLCIGCVNKPFDIAVLLGMVERACQHLLQQATDTSAPAPPPRTSRR